MVNYTEEALKHIAKEDLRNDRRSVYEGKQAWPATRRYSHEEWTLFFDTFRRGIFEQKDAKKSDTIFLVYPARIEPGFTLAKKFFEDRFKKEYKFKIKWTELRLRVDNLGVSQASFDEEFLRQILQEANKGEVHFMLLISVKDDKQEQLRADALKATVALFKKVGTLIPLYRKSHFSLLSEDQRVTFNLRILVADLLQAYNQLSHETKPEHFNDKIQGELSTHWEQNGQKWIDDAGSSFDVLKNTLKSLGVRPNINFTPWREILQEAKKVYGGFEANLAALEAFSTSKDQRSESFSREVNFKANFHHLVFAKEEEKIYSALLDEKLVECKKRFDEEDSVTLQRVQKKISEYNKQNEPSLETKNIIGYSKEDNEANESFSKKMHLLFNKGEKEIAPTSVSRRFNLVPSKQASLAPRKKLLTEINEKLSVFLQDTTPHKLLCLHGIGGAGKTTLATLYHYSKEKSPYSGALWIEARAATSDKDNAFKKYVKQFASQLNLSEKFEQNHAESRRAIRNGIYDFLNGKKSPLLIIIDDISFNSLEEEQTFHQFLLEILPYPNVYVSLMNDLSNVPTGEQLTGAAISHLAVYSQTTTASREKETNVEEENIIHRSLNAEEQHHVALGYHVYRCMKFSEAWRIFVFKQNSWEEEPFAVDSDILQFLKEKEVSNAAEVTEEAKRYLEQYLIKRIPRCRVLLTSRSRLTSFLPNHHFTIEMIEISGMERSEARSFLSSNTRLPESVIDGAQRIAEKFSFLPLMVSLLKDNLLTMDETAASELLSSDMLGLNAQKETLENIFWKFIKNIQLSFEDDQLKEAALNQVKKKAKEFIKDILYACSFASTNSIRLAMLRAWFDRYYALVKSAYKLDVYLNSERIFNAIKRELLKRALLSYDEKKDMLSMHMVTQEVFQHILKKENSEHIDEIIYSLVRFLVSSDKAVLNHYNLDADREVLTSIVRYANTETLCGKIVDFFESQLSSPVLSQDNRDYICEANSLLGYNVAETETNAWQAQIERRRLEINSTLYFKNPSYIVYDALKHIVKKLHRENLEQVITELFLYYIAAPYWDKIEEIAEVLNEQFKNQHFSEELAANVKCERPINDLLFNALKRKHFNTSKLLVKLRPDLNYVFVHGQTLITYIVAEACNVALTQEAFRYAGFSSTTKENCLKISRKELQPNSAKAGYQYYKTLNQINDTKKTADFHRHYAGYCAATGRFAKAEKHIKAALQLEECASSFVIYAIILRHSSLQNYNKIQELLDKARHLSHDTDIDFQSVIELLDSTLADEMRHIEYFKISPWLLATWLLILFHYQQDNASMALAVFDDLKKYSDQNPDKKLPMALLAHAAILFKQHDLSIATFESLRDPSEALCRRMPFDAKTSYKISRDYALKAQTFKAVSYIKKAALEGHVYARVLCADYYAINSLFFDSVRREEKLLFWCQKIINHLPELHERAMHHDVEAQHYLSLCYDSGLGLPVDHDKAFYWAIRASEQGYVFALNLVGYYFHHGMGVAKSAEKARCYYQLAAAKKYSVSQRNLYFNLKDKNELASLIWLEKSAHDGHPQSQYEWAEHLSEKSTHITPEIFNLYQQAAENQHALSQLKIAEFYENGIVVEKNLDRAEIFYNKAESNLPESECIYLVKGVDTGRNAWYYVLVHKRCVHKFLSALNDKIIHLENHGKVLNSAFGDEPPQSVTEELKKKYNIKDSNDLVINFPPYISSVKLCSFFYHPTPVSRRFTSESYLVDHRHDHPSLQHLYDQRFGLTIRRCFSFYKPIHSIAGNRVVDGSECEFRTAARTNIVNLN